MACPPCHISIKNLQICKTKYSFSSISFGSLINLCMVIKELTLLTNDITVTKKFYHHLMEFPVLEETVDKISFRIGSSILVFQLTQKYSTPFYHVAFSISNNKLLEALDWVSKRTSILPYSENETIADFVGWNAKAFYFHDSQENILEFITHFDLNTQEKNFFTSLSVQSICEIGIVTDDVSATSKEIIEQYHIPHFSKGPLLEDFAVMGDADGLLIISKTHRGWLPTQRPCEKFPVKLLTASNGEIKELLF
jgi:hypothetical protein